MNTSMIGENHAILIEYIANGTQNKRFSRGKINDCRKIYIYFQRQNLFRVSECAYLFPGDDFRFGRRQESGYNK